MTELRKTPLYASHREAQARMVDFGGWDMPVNYGSQIDEHHAVRRAAGMFDVSHMCTIDIAGERARDLLRHALANNVDKLQDTGRALYTCMLNHDGGVVDDLIVTYFGDAFPGQAPFRLVVNAATAEKDLAWLVALNEEGGFGASLTPRRDLAMLAVQGPAAREAVWRAVPDAGLKAASEPLKPFNATFADTASYGLLMLARTGYTGEDGFEITVLAEHAAALWQALVEAGVKPCGLGARDTLRLEAGMNLYGQDMDDTVSPLDAGLAWTVDLAAPRDFVGKAALLAATARSGIASGSKSVTPGDAASDTGSATAGSTTGGTAGGTTSVTSGGAKPIAGFHGVLLRPAPGSPGGILRAHQVIETAHGAGELTSGTFSPTLQASIGFARLPAQVQPGDDVTVVIRDKRLAATIVKLPFVRRGKVLVS